jgi:hypothetical protein
MKSAQLRNASLISEANNNGSNKHSSSSETRPAAQLPIETQHHPLVLAQRGRTLGAAADHATPGALHSRPLSPNVAAYELPMSPTATTSRRSPPGTGYQHSLDREH